MSTHAPHRIDPLKGQHGYRGWSHRMLYEFQGAVYSRDPHETVQEENNKPYNYFVEFKVILAEVNGLDEAISQCRRWALANVFPNIPSHRWDEYKDFQPYVRLSEIRCLDMAVVVETTCVFCELKN